MLHEQPGKIFRERAAKRFDPRNASSRDPARILILDPVVGSRFALANIVAQPGVLAELASSVEEARLRLARGGVALILVDDDLGNGVRGLEFLIEVRTLHPEVRRALVVAEHQTELRREDLERADKEQEMSSLDGIGIDSAIKAAETRQSEQDKLGQNQFLEMLVAQLENQDPLNPQDSAEFAAQLAQFSSVEQLISMRSGIDELVAAFKEQASNTDPTKNLDPANLVGKEVVVFGKQIEIDAERNPIELPLRNADTAVEATVQIRDSNGTIRYQGSVLPVDENGPVAMRPGDHTFEFDPKAHNLPEGVYRVEFVAKGIDGKPVTILPMVTGIVSGAVLAGEPAVRIGARLFKLSDILEVRMAPGTDASESQTSSLETGLGQSVVQPTGGRTAS